MSRRLWPRPSRWGRPGRRSRTCAASPSASLHRLRAVSSAATVSPHFPSESLTQRLPQQCAAGAGGRGLAAGLSAVCSAGWARTQAPNIRPGRAGNGAYADHTAPGLGAPRLLRCGPPPCVYHSCTDSPTGTTHGAPHAYATARGSVRQAQLKHSSSAAWRKHCRCSPAAHGPQWSSRQTRTRMAVARAAQTPRAAERPLLVQVCHRRVHRQFLLRRRDRVGVLRKQELLDPPHGPVRKLVERKEGALQPLRFEAIAAGCRGRLASRHRRWPWRGRGPVP